MFFGAALAAVILLAGGAVEAVPDRDRRKIAGLGQPAIRLLYLGLAITVVTLALTWPEVSSGSFHGWFVTHVDGACLALALLAAGQLLMAWPARGSRAGQFACPLALVVVAALALWAGGVYAGTLGYQAALGIQDDVAGQTAVTASGAQPLNLSGPGVTCSRVQPGAGFSWERTGLRLLRAESGTYHLLPRGWKSRDDPACILDDSDQIRIELYQPWKPGSAVRVPRFAPSTTA